MNKYTKNASNTLAFLGSITLKSNSEIGSHLLAAGVKKVSDIKDSSKIIEYARDNERCSIERKPGATIGNNVESNANNDIEEDENPEVALAEKKAITPNDLLVYREQTLRLSPYLPKSVYENLPESLAEICKDFEGRGRDIILLSSLTILSGCFPTVYGKYDQKKVHAPLYLFIVAPPASDKSMMATAKAIGMPIHKYISTIPFGTDLESVSRKFKRLLFMPCDSSAAALIKNLQRNYGIGIMCETEADTMGNSLKQDWGSYSDLLRKAFHHEHIHQSRKKDDEYNEISSVQLAVLLTGTPNQVKEIIKSAEDGLASRFGYYFFSQKQVWRDVFATEDSDFLEDKFHQYGEYFLKIHKAFQEKSVLFKFTREQQNRHHIFCKRRFNEIIKLEGAGSASSIKRLGLILYRIAMVLTVVRSKGTVVNGTMVCDNIDYLTSESIMNVLITHAVTMLKFLESHGKIAYTNRNEAAIIQLLKKGTEYKRYDIVSLYGKSQNKPLSDRTIDTALKTLCDKKLLVAYKHGVYKRPD